MRGQCIVCGKPVADMAVIVIAEGWRHCCRQLYPPLYPPRVPAVPYGLAVEAVPLHGIVDLVMD